MACFLGCFGFPSKRKRRKPATRILAGDQTLVCYEPLESAASAEFKSSKRKSTTSKVKGQAGSVKIRKKVSFNLDVQTYEPIQVEETAVYHLLDSTIHQDKEEDSGNTREGNSSHSGTHNYPSNYRYLNCRDSYHDEEEIKDDESDLESDEDYDDADEDYDDDDDEDYDDAADEVTDDQTARKERSMDHSETKTWRSADKPLIHVNQEAGCGTWPGCTNARIRGQCPTSVLDPIENTTQWRAIKASAPHPSKHRRKENIEVVQPLGSSKRFEAPPPFSSVPQCNQMRPLVQGIAVNASLSNWLGSPSTRATNSNTTKNNKLPEKSIR